MTTDHNREIVAGLGLVIVLKLVHMAGAMLEGFRDSAHRDHCARRLDTIHQDVERLKRERR